MRARSWWWWAAFALAAVPTVGGAMPRGSREGAGQRAAQQPAAGTQIEVLVIDASNGDAGLDPGLATLSQLRRAPFSMFTAMRLVSRSTLALATDPSRATLPDGTATVIAEAKKLDPELTYLVDILHRNRAPL